MTTSEGFTIEKRKYRKIQELLPIIEAKIDSGQSRSEIEKEGRWKEIDRLIHNLIKRERRKILRGIPKQRGRKTVKTLREYKYENKRLMMQGGESEAERKEYVIYRHQQESSVAAMCRFLGVSRGEYYDFLKRLGKPERDAA